MTVNCLWGGKIFPRGGILQHLLSPYAICTRRVYIYFTPLPPLSGRCRASPRWAGRWVGWSCGGPLRRLGAGPLLCLAGGSVPGRCPLVERAFGKPDRWSATRPGDAYANDRRDTDGWSPLGLPFGYRSGLRVCRARDTQRKPARVGGWGRSVGGVLVVAHRRRACARRKGGLRCLIGNETFECPVGVSSHVCLVGVSVRQCETSQ